MEKKESKAVETTAPHPNKIGIKEGIGYMLGDAGNLFVLTYVSSFLKVFYTDVLKIATDKVATLFGFASLGCGKRSYVGNDCCKKAPK